MNPFRRFPIATFVSIMTAVQAGAIVLDGEHVLHGSSAAYLQTGIAILGVLLGAYTKRHATPKDDPKDRDGRPLVPAEPASPRSNL